MKTTFKVTSNKSKKHFTININGVKFRTLHLSKDEFEEAEYNTENDWKDYVRNSGNVKTIN